MPVLGVQSFIQAQDVDSGLAQETQVAGFGELGDQGSNVLRGCAAGLRYAIGLGVGGFGAEVRVEAAAAGG